MEFVIITVNHKTPPKVVILIILTQEIMKSKDYEEELKEWFRIEDTLRKAKKDKERMELENALNPDEEEKKHRRQDASFERELEMQREDFFARKREERRLREEEKSKQKALDEKEKENKKIMNTRELEHKGQAMHDTLEEIKRRKNERNRGKDLGR